MAHAKRLLLSATALSIAHKEELRLSILEGVALAIFKNVHRCPKKQELKVNENEVGEMLRSMFSPSNSQERIRGIKGRTVVKWSVRILDTWCVTRYQNIGVIVTEAAPRTQCSNNADLSANRLE